MKITSTANPAPLVTESEAGSDKGAVAAPKKGAAEAPAKAADCIELSATVRSRVPAGQRAERIAALKAGLAAGTYRVSSRQVAEKMLADGFEP